MKNDSSRIPRRRPFSALHGDDRAATLAFMAVAMVVLLGSTALAVDMGMFIFGRVQSQRAADAGALAGASELTTASGTADAARAEAKKFANMHEILDQNANVTDGDVDVEMTDPRLVRVRVEHTFNTIFARIIGIDQVDVATTAAAEVQPAGGAVCAIPIAAIDRWEDWDHDDDPPTDPDTESNGQWDGGDPPPNPVDADELYIQCTGQNDGTCTGFNTDANVLGPSFSDRRIEIKTSPNDDFDPTNLQQTCQANTSPGWLCWIRPPGMSGANDLKDIVRGCENQTWSVAEGDNVFAETGNTQSLVKEFRDFINDNGGTDVEWDPSATDPNNNPGCLKEDGVCLEDPDSHPRVRPVPLVSPGSVTSGGSGSNAEVSNLVNVFIEKVATCATCAHKANGGVGGHNLYVILMEGAAGGQGTGGPSGSLLNTVVLVE